MIDGRDVDGTIVDERLLGYCDFFGDRTKDRVEQMTAL